MGHRWCKERTKKNGGDTAEGETHRQVAMGERKEDERSGKEGARVQANHRFRAKMADKRVQNDEKGKKKIKSARKQRDEWGGGQRVRLFPALPGTATDALHPPSAAFAPLCTAAIAPVVEFQRPSPPLPSTLQLTFTLPHCAATARADQSGLRNRLRGI